jgi:hypothetical protein
MLNGGRVSQTITWHRAGHTKKPLLAGCGFFVATELALTASESLALTRHLLVDSAAKVNSIIYATKYYSNNNIVFNIILQIILFTFIKLM